MAAVLKALSVLSFFLAWKTYKLPTHMSNSSTFTSNGESGDGDRNGNARIRVQLSDLDRTAGSTALDSPDDNVVENGMPSSLSTENLTSAIDM